MSRRIIRFIGIALVLGAVAVAWSPLSTFFAVDSCLDAGGSFDYVKGVCDYTRSHPYLARDSTARISVAALLAIGGLAAIVAASHRGSAAVSRNGE
jgi:hypothetical protein